MFTQKIKTTPPQRPGSTILTRRDILHYARAWIAILQGYAPLQPSSQRNRDDVVPPKDGGGLTAPYLCGQTRKHDIRHLQVGGGVGLVCRRRGTAGLCGSGVAVDTAGTAEGRGPSSGHALPARSALAAKLPASSDCPARDGQTTISFRAILRGRMPAGEPMAPAKPGSGGQPGLIASLGGEVWERTAPASRPIRAAEGRGRCSMLAWS